MVLRLLRGVVISDSDDEVRGVALKALRQIGRRGEEDTLLAARCALEEQGAGADLRLQAADCLQAIATRGDAGSMRAALSALKDSDCSVRSAGLATLRRICGPRGECGEFLGDLAAVATGHEDAEVRSAALELIPLAEDVGGAYGIAVATAGLQDSDEEVAKTALGVLRRLWPTGDIEAVATLGALVQNARQSPSLRCVALDALWHVARRGDGAAAAAAAAALDDPDSSVQMSAVQALKQLEPRGNEMVLATLVGYTAQRNGEVQRCAVEALGFVATDRSDEALDMLRNLQAGGDDDLQLLAERALRQVR
mmetsp:Transcript_54335/g.111159  ORF Transcript_54335/g.111159 Transcript_54335/m.111159 type:complete len:310 (-) Transcript_54335:177-1106(-)